MLLAFQGLADNPTERLGFVQLDSIKTVERAHHHILFSRNQTYRREQLDRLTGPEAVLFENWTHDAAIIPARFYPFWRHRFARDRDRLAERWRRWRREGFEDFLAQVRARIAREGPLMARDFGSERKKRSGGWWNWHPEKTALEYLWRTGALAVARREGFQKVYDLPERVIPKRYRGRPPARKAFIDWTCRSALVRLGVATPAELAAFWGALGTAEAGAWCEAQLGNGLTRVLVEPADGAQPRAAFAAAETLERLDGLPKPPPRIRALNPFDPVIRDRARLERLFGFRYRIEVFVPAAKRRYGYYVFPLLEGERFIGRIDMTHDSRNGSRDGGVLKVTGLWLEPEVAVTRGREDKLQAELGRIQRFVGAAALEFTPR